MVNRRRKILVVLLSGLGLLLVMVTWLFGTSAGARWAFARLSDWSALEVAAGTIDGRLAGRQGAGLGWRSGPC